MEADLIERKQDSHVLCWLSCFCVYVAGRYVLLLAQNTKENTVKKNSMSFEQLFIP